ncbi:MAG TPA: RodZ domain-containing protein [Verrucomicrobiae bacterium]|jgi:cytoskeletal protein RodZ|nr:RodZ domain-containing protein [Verrucomicrobiae bacterium]
MPALGERFRAAREARGLTLSEVAEQIRIRSVYLGAIEEENWSLIGAPVYIRGFLRTYARFLGIDPEEAVAAFNSQTAAPSEPSAEESATRPRAGSKELRPFIWIASAIAVALVAFVVYNEIVLQQRHPAAVAVATATPAPAPSVSPSAQTNGSSLPSASPLASPSPGSQTMPGPSTIAVRLVALSWLRITVDGNVTIEGTFPAGTERTFRGKYASVRVGNAGGVQIIVDGKSIGLLGKTGVVADRTFTL